MIAKCDEKKSARLFELARMAHRKGNIDEAKSSYEAVLKANPDHYAAIYALAMLTDMEDGPFQTIILLQKTLEKNPKYAKAWCKLGLILIGSNLEHEGVKALSQAASLDSQHYSDLYGAALSCFAKGRIGAAILALKNLLQLQPDIPEVHYSLGLIFSSQKELASAETHFKRAIELRNDYPEAHKNLGQILMESSRLAESALSFERAVALDPSNHEAFRFLGDVYRDIGRFDKALSAYNSEYELTTNKIGCQIDIGLTYMQQGDFGSACNTFKNIIAKDAGISEAHYNLGLVYHKQMQLENAAKSYRDALDINPKNIGAHNNLAMVLDQLGRKSEAIAHYQQILTIDPDNQGARHIFAALTGEQLKTASPEYVMSLFDQYSDGFEADLKNNLKYTIPTQLKESIAQFVEGEVNFHNALDLGCGTGMCGQEFWEIATNITGVDLSSKMLGKASRKGVYNSLVNRDIVDYLDECKDYYDLFIAADVFIYVGDLESVFRAVQNRSVPGGCFTFSVERCAGNSYWLCPSGRYAHSRNYINKLASLNSFSVERCTPTGIRLENNKWIEGDIYILKSYKLLPLQSPKWADISVGQGRRPQPSIPGLH